jgi:hypothetical protein
MMKSSTSFALVLLAWAGVSTVGAQTQGTPRLDPKASGRTPHPETIRAPQVTGAIAWSSNYGAKPAAGDACSNFKLTVFEVVPSNPAPGGIDAGAGEKDTGIHGHGAGTISKGACSYYLTGVPTDKPVKVSITYVGPMSKQANSNRVASDAFTLEKGKTYVKDLKLVLTQVK